MGRLIKFVFMTSQLLSLGATERACAVRVFILWETLGRVRLPGENWWVVIFELFVVCSVLKLGE